MKFSRAFYTPQTFTGHYFKKAIGYEAYTENRVDSSGKTWYYYTVWTSNRQQKPASMSRCSSEEARKESLKYWYEQAVKKHQTAKARNNKFQSHGLEEGDIVYESWGYEQTNVDFWQVVEVKGRCTAIVRKVAVESAGEYGPMSGQILPLKDQFISEDFRVRSDKHGYLQRDGHTLYKWDGKPKSWSSYH